MSRVKASLDHKRIRRLVWLVLTVFVLLGYSLQSVAGSAYYSMVMQASGTVSSPPVILEEGNVSGASTIYTNKTSAKVNVTAPVPIYDFVDNNTSDVDSSGVDKGTHSNFTAQQYGPDSIFDVLTEENTGGGGAWQWEYAESFSESSSSSTSFTEKVRLTFTPNSVGDWLIITTFQGRHTNTGDSFEVRGELDDTYTICLPNQEPEINDENREYKTFGHFRVFQDLSASEHHVDVDYRTQDSGTTMYIKNVRIVAIQIEDIDGVNNTYQEAEGQVQGTSGWTDTVEASITPTDTNKKYLVIGCLDVQPSTSTSYYTEARISVDDTAYYPEEAPVGTHWTSTTKDTGDWLPLWSYVVVTLTSGAHTVALQIRGSSTYSDYRYRRILVLRLDDVYDYEYVSNPTENSQTGTTWKDASTMQFNSSATDYLILASMCGRLNTSGYSFQNRFTIGGVSQIDHNEEQSDASYRSFQYAGIKTLLAESQTFKTQFRAYDAARTAYVKESFIIAVKKPLQPKYELDLEVQWTNADYDETNEELAIYVDKGSNTHSLDATGGYMIIGDGTSDWGSTTGTISFWIKMDTSVQGRFWGQDGDMETRFSGGTYLILDWGADGSMTSAYSFSADAWYFVAIVWNENNDNLFLYIGDENNPPTLDANSLNGNWTSTTPPPTENRFMNGLGGNEPVNGRGDDLRYWSIARSLTAIQNDYNKTLSGSEPNLQSYFKLDNNFDDIGPNDDDGSGSGSYSFSYDVPFDAAPTENIRVDVWNGTWQNLFTDLTNGWNHISVSSYLTSSNFTIRFNGGNENGDTTQDSWYIDATLLNVWTSESTYDYVLQVVNQVEEDNWTINLQVYESSDINRLLKTTISFHDGSPSDQIIVNYGAITQPEGPTYNLPAGLGSTIYISMSNLQATTTGTSYLYVHLKIRVPGTSVYMLYVITFEIT